MIVVADDDEDEDDLFESGVLDVTVGSVDFLLDFASSAELLIKVLSALISANAANKSLSVISPRSFSFNASRLEKETSENEGDLGSDPKAKASAAACNVALGDMDASNDGDVVDNADDGWP